MRRTPDFLRRLPSSRELDAAEYRDVDAVGFARDDRECVQSEPATELTAQVEAATLTRESATTRTYARFTSTSLRDQNARPSAGFWIEDSSPIPSLLSRDDHAASSWPRRPESYVVSEPLKATTYSVHNRERSDPYDLTRRWQRGDSEQYQMGSLSTAERTFHEPPCHPLPSRYLPGFHAQGQDIAAGLPGIQRSESGSGSDYAGNNAREDNDADSGEVSDDEMVITEPNVPRTSRYLREMDRRVILERLAQGEKQATLAKEFNVSRAAISNLFKHRQAILARSDGDPFAKHPKTKKQPTKPLARPQESGRNRSESDPSGIDTHASLGANETLMSNLPLGPRDRNSRSPSSRLHVVNNQALQLLLSAMTAQDITLAEFHRTTERILWLLLEEALAHVPVKEVERDSSSSIPSYAVESPPCAVTLEQQSLGVTPMLRIFQLMEPRQPSATASVLQMERGYSVEIPDTGLPERLRGYNVFLLDVVSASGDIVCAAIQKLIQQFGVAETNLSLVALFTSSEVVAMVQCQYPRAKIVTARIDSTITRRRVASSPVDRVLDRVREVYRPNQL